MSGNEGLAINWKARIKKAIYICLKIIHNMLLILFSILLTLVKVKLNYTIVSYALFFLIGDNFSTKHLFKFFINKFNSAFLSSTETKIPIFNSSFAISNSIAIFFKPNKI